MRIIKLIISYLFWLALSIADQATSATGTITPNNVTAGTSNQNFTYSLTFTGGTADSINITNPLVEYSIIATGVTIDGSIKSLINQNLRPNNQDDVSWFYDVDNYRLIIICDSSAISTSLVIDIVQSMPQTITSNNQYTSVYDDISDPSGSVSVTEDEWTVDVVAGSVSAIFIEDEDDGTGTQIGNVSLNTGGSLTLHSVGRDQYNNFVQSIISAWSVENDIGEISPSTASSTVFNPITIGSGAISAQYTVFSDQTGIITVSGGSLSYLLIRDEANGGGSEVGDVTMTTDESLILYAAGYDADNNYLSDVNGSWDVVGSLDGIASSGTSVEFSPSTSSTSGTIVVSSTGVTSDATGTITVINPPIIWFVEGTLFPSIIYAGLDTNFSMTVSNVGDLSVTLNPSTNFTFSDGFETFTSVLNESTYIEQSSNALLVFENQTVPNTLTPGQYTPYLNAIGFDEDGNNYNQAGIQIGSNPLSLAGFTINSIFCSNEQVWPGQDSILVTITVTSYILI